VLFNSFIYALLPQCDGPWEDSFKSRLHIYIHLQKSATLQHILKSRLYIHTSSKVGYIYTYIFTIHLQKSSTLQHILKSRLYIHTSSKVGYIHTYIFKSWLHRGIHLQKLAENMHISSKVGYIEMHLHKSGKHLQKSTTYQIYHIN